MNYLDRILELLRDSNWHSVGEVKSEIALPSDELNEILSFLQGQAFINKDNDKLRITPRGLRLLELPSN